MESHKPAWASCWHGTSFRVRYQETDQMGVVYHGNYLTWFESGRTEMFRQLGFAYRSLEELGLLLPVTAADLQFKSPARYDDLIAVYARLTTFSALRVVYEYEVRRVADEDEVSGVNGASATFGLSGASAASGVNGASATFGVTGASGVNGASATSGVLGASGVNGASATSGVSGASGVNGASATSGVLGASATSGASGVTGASGTIKVRPADSRTLPGELLVSGSTSHVWLNKEWKPVRMDRAQPELFRAIATALKEEEGGAV